MKDTKEIILETAYNMFLYNNYEAVTISSIIKATGLTKGAIYHYYDSKETLFKAVVDKYMLENCVDTTVEFDTLETYIQFSIDGVRKKMTKIVEDNPNFANEVPINYLSLIIAAHRYYPDYAKIGNLFMESQMMKWEKAIEKARTNGEIRGDIDVEATITNFFNIGSGIISSMFRRGSIDYALDLFERQYWQYYNCLKK